MTHKDDSTRTDKDARTRVEEPGEDLESFPMTNLGRLRGAFPTRITGAKPGQPPVLICSGHAWLSCYLIIISNSICASVCMDIWRSLHRLTERINLFLYVYVGSLIWVFANGGHGG